MPPKDLRFISIWSWKILKQYVSGAPDLLYVIWSSQIKKNRTTPSQLLADSSVTRAIPKGGRAPPLKQDTKPKVSVFKLLHGFLGVPGGIHISYGTVWNKHTIEIPWLWKSFQRNINICYLGCLWLRPPFWSKTFCVHGISIPYQIFRPIYHTSIPNKVVRPSCNFRHQLKKSTMQSEAGTIFTYLYRVCDSELGNNVESALHKVLVS